MLGKSLYIYIYIYIYIYRVGYNVAHFLQKEIVRII